MSEMVKCDICGRISNKSYIRAHKRLAHGKPAPAYTMVGEADAVEVISTLFARLSDERKREVRERLLAATPSAR